VNDHLSLLEQVGERADPGTLPSPERIRAAVTRRRRRATALATAVAIVVVVAGGVELGSRPTSQSPSSPVDGPAPTATGDPSPTATSAPVLPGYGTPVTVEPRLDYFDIRAVTYLDAQGGGRSVYVVVGDTSGTFDGPRPVPPIWWSVDGQTWNHASTGPAFPNVWDVTAYGGGLVAVAPRGLHASTAWYSVDGDHWRQGVVPQGFHAFGVSSTENGLFAWDDHRIFTSTDGQEWSEVPHAPDLSGVSMCFIQDIRGKTVLGASSRAGDPFTWTLQGSTWAADHLPLTSPSTGTWCQQHEIEQTSAVGPTGTVSVVPNDEYPDTVFLKGG
jgi:hypothetical protein